MDSRSWTRGGALVAAGLLGGAAAVGIGAAVDSDEAGGMTTVLSTATASPSARFAVDDESAKSVQEIYVQSGPGVVQVTSTSVVGNDPFFGSQPRQSLGSGFVIDKSGRIVTNFHVIDGAQEVEVNFSGDDRVPARVVGSDPSTDLAVLEIDAQARALTPLPLGNSDAVRVGDSVVAIGNPFGLERTVTAGIVSALQREITAPNGYTIDKVIQTDAPINHGNSGGPLLDARGRVVGVNAQIQGGTVDANVGIGFAISSDTARSVAQQLIAGGHAQHAWLGVQVETIDPDLAKVVRGLPAHGVVVARVVKGSPAAVAGLAAASRQVTVDGVSGLIGGDAIVALDGKSVTSSAQLADDVALHKPGDKLQLEVVRDGKSRTVDVTLENVPSHT